MPKQATKASNNDFYKARIAASSCNDRLASREGASEELGIDRTRLARIELGSLNPYPEEVLIMADYYDAPELANHYCSKMCPLGKKTVPPAEMRSIDRLTIRIISALGEANGIKEAMGSLQYAGQFQQVPAPAEGVIFKREWLQSFYRDGAAPVTTDIQSWDMAFTKSEGSAKVAGFVMGRKGADIYIKDLVNDNKGCRTAHKEAEIPHQACSCTVF